MRLLRPAGVKLYSFSGIVAVATGRAVAAEGGKTIRAAEVFSGAATAAGAARPGATGKPA